MWAFPADTRSMTSQLSNLVVVVGAAIMIALIWTFYKPSPVLGALASVVFAGAAPNHLRPRDRQIDP